MDIFIQYLQKWICDNFGDTDAIQVTGAKGFLEDTIIIRLKHF